MPQKKYNITEKGTEKDTEWIKVDTTSVQRMTRIL